MRHSCLKSSSSIRKEWKDVLDEVAWFWFFETFIESVVQGMRKVGGRQTCPCHRSRLFLNQSWTGVRWRGGWRWRRCWREDNDERLEREESEPISVSIDMQSTSISSSSSSSASSFSISSTYTSKSSFRSDFHGMIAWGELRRKLRSSVLLNVLLTRVLLNLE